jgi:hypothetical protein
VPDGEIIFLSIEPGYKLLGNIDITFVGLELRQENQSMEYHSGTQWP